ncbi:hypothetical protein [Brevibacillus brevis]|uniref:hypothetical protein n=1 Tax=Brevibacillus brevis TaxID=1393 RepID=UPI0031B86A13
MAQLVKERIRKQYGKLTGSQKIICKIAIEKPSLLAIHTAKKLRSLRIPVKQLSFAFVTHWVTPDTQSFRKKSKSLF